MSSDQSPAALRPLSFAGTTAAQSAEPQASAERARAATQGYADGFAAGMRAATHQAHQQRERVEAELQEQKAALRAELDAAGTALGAAADALHQRALGAVADADHAVIEAALSIAEAVLGSELQHQEHAAAAALRRTAGELEASQVRAVRMHPETMAAVPSQLLQGAQVRLIADSRLAPGDAVADLHEGFIDARITTALQRCRAALAGPGELP